MNTIDNNFLFMIFLNIFWKERKGLNWKICYNIITYIFVELFNKN